MAAPGPGDEAGLLDGVIQFVWDPSADPVKAAAVVAKRKSRGAAGSSTDIPIDSRPAFDRLPHLEQAEAAAAAHRAAKKEAAETAAAAADAEAPSSPSAASAAPPATASAGAAFDAEPSARGGSVDSEALKSTEGASPRTKLRRALGSRALPAP